MIKWLLGAISGTVYVQIWEERLKLAHVEKRTVFDEKPYIAIETGGKSLTVKAVGNSALALSGSANIAVSNPFSHPRLLISSFQKAEKVLQHGVRQLFKSQSIVPSPVLVIHPMEKLEGGITDVECRLFRELGLGAGAKKVYLHIGDEIPLSHFSLDRLNKPGEI